MLDKEAEVRSEAIGKLPILCKYSSASSITEKIIPIIISNSVTDTSQHVRGSLAHAICDLAKFIGKENAIKHITPPVSQLLKDQSTEVRVTLMQNMKNLAAVIGSEDIDKHIIPAIIEMSNDKNWRVKLAIIEFIPLLCELIDKDIFKNRLESVVLGWLQDNVFQIREEAINTLITLKDTLFNLAWLE
jgi:serine/threonine-protein phosphatase 2A regulatory subunit A